MLSFPTMFAFLQVETIGDAYMCVSGLPERIGNNHVTEICDMSFAILHTVRGFKVRHMPSEQLSIRIGINSGPVVAGVVGLTMPRYCLFGDTVNTASRMESTSETMKIQLSASSARLLAAFPDYVTEPRGDVEIKGKGTMVTHWLLNVRHRMSVIEPFSLPVASTSVSHHSNGSNKTLKRSHEFTLDVSVVEKTLAKYIFQVEVSSGPLKPN
ncbi:ANPRA-like protein [Mya arenaria]|uniref:ANPRA-like protein n=1 Tax=Mya arenaria TaxID=6604 RepID=A0ABY7F202_MYAAR|nr:ANPRA-like protein [Mya arenaria]